MIAPNWYPDHKQLRQFAVACLPGFALIGYGLHRWTGSTSLLATAVAIGAACCVAGLRWPETIRPVYIVMTTLTLPLGWLASQVFLHVVFYGLLTPLGLVFRVMRRDPLRLTKPDATSYWQEHQQQADPVTYYRQS